MYIDCTADLCVKYIFKSRIEIHKSHRDYIWYSRCTSNIVLTFENFFFFVIFLPVPTANAPTRIHPSTPVVWYHAFICDMTHLQVTRPIHVWHDPFTCDMSHLCDMTSHVWRDFFMWHDWHLTRDMTYSGDETHSHVTWPIHMWHDTFVWHGSFTCDMAHSHTT